ncbi:MAG: DUF1272 domain-containing protein [Anaeromyxobacter sp.]
MSTPMKPACERCGTPLPPESPDARVCSHGCTWCSACAAGPLAHRCPNCSGGLERRPIRLALPPLSAGSACERSRPFTARARRYHGVAVLGEWRVKRYALWSVERAPPDAAALDEALRLARAVLDRAARGGLGFVILHHGRDGDYLLVDWWSDEDVLNHRLLVRPTGEPAFRDPRQASWLACVWELELVAGERDLWVETTMADPPRPYLERHVADSTGREAPRTTAS